MKRKKWTEAEEETLITAYSDLLSSRPMFSLLRTREKKFQPIADRLNSLHHTPNPAAFPFRWSWRDVSVKIQNMRHQYLNTKLKLTSPSSPDSPDLDLALNLWPNFLRYKAVFGDIDPDSSPSSSSHSSPHRKISVLVGREESRRGLLREERRRRRSEIDEAEERRERWRRREESRDEEEMEWREKLMVMQMEHEKRVMQMHADACRSQIQMLGILVRFACQFLSPSTSSGAGGNDGLQGLAVQNSQQQVSSGSLVGDGGKNDDRSGEGYL